MTNHVKYIVTPVAGDSPAVRITTETSGGPWVDDSADIIMRAVKPEALPLMQAYLSGLGLDTSWTARESGGNAYRMDGLVPGGNRQVSLNSCVEYRRSPKHWSSILLSTPAEGPDNDDFEDLLEISLLDEKLAEQLYQAIVAGTLQVEFA